MSSKGLRLREIVVTAILAMVVVVGMCTKKYAVLTVELVHIKKPKQRNRGSIRAFAATPNDHDDDNEDGSEDGDASMVTSS